MASAHDGPRRIDVHLSLTRPLLLMGCEREPLLLSAVLAAALVLTVGNLLLAIVGITFWVIAVAVLRRVAKADYAMSKIYLRHMRYATFYSAKSHVTAIYPTIKRQQ